MHQFLEKRDNFELFSLNLSKIGFWGRNFKNVSLDSKSTTNFYIKKIVLIFWPKFAQQWTLGLVFLKSKSRFGISILEILWAPIFRQNGQLWFFAPKFAQKWILGSEFRNSKSGFGISSLEILCAPVFRKNGQVWIFGHKFATKAILGSKFQKSKCRFEISIL